MSRFHEQSVQNELAKDNFASSELDKANKNLTGLVKRNNSALQIDEEMTKLYMALRRVSPDNRITVATLTSWKRKVQQKAEINHEYWCVPLDAARLRLLEEDPEIKDACIFPGDLPDLPPNVDFSKAALIDVVIPRTRLGKQVSRVVCSAASVRKKVVGGGKRQAEAGGLDEPEADPILKWFAGQGT